MFNHALMGSLMRKAVEPGDYWEQVADFGGTAVRLSSVFVLDGAAYVCGGFTTTEVVAVWAFDFATGTWSQKANLPSARQGAVSFSGGGYGYVTTGFRGSSDLTDTLKYDGQGNTWSSVANFGGSSRRGASVFVIDGEAYVCGGTSNPSPYLADVWAMSFATETWSQKASLPAGVRYASGCGCGGQGFVITGRKSTGKTKDNLRYDAAANGWSVLAAFGGEGRDYSASFVIGNNIYIGTGFAADNTRLKDFWVYSTIADAWLEKAEFLGTGRIASIGFSDGVHGYIGAGNDGTANKNDYYKYTP